MEQRVTLDEDYFYSCKELAFIWNLSSETIRRLFLREKDVMVVPSNRRGRKRIYRTLRIPGRVAIRVKARMTVVE
jgi:hypothetical protein